MHRGGMLKRGVSFSVSWRHHHSAVDLGWLPPGCPAVLPPTAVKLCAGAAAAAVEHAAAVTSGCAGWAAQCGCIPCSHLYRVQVKWPAGWPI